MKLTNLLFFKYTTSDPIHIPYFKVTPKPLTRHTDEVLPLYFLKDPHSKALLKGVRGRDYQQKRFLPLQPRLAPKALTPVQPLSNSV